MKNFTFTFILSVLLFIIPNIITAQCNIVISNLPDTILACKNTSVQVNPSVTITSGAPDLIDTTWNTSIGVSDSTIINPFITTGVNSSNYILTITAVTPTNLILNGDFSLGNNTFSSSYIYGTGGPFGLLSNSGEYAVSTNPSLTHVNFANFGDHTSGAGNMMVINGASIANVNIWCQTIPVNPNTWYDFSAWGATCVASSPAILQFSINGVLTGTPLALPLTTGVWTQFHTTWFSGINTSINICITDQATAASGNDFAIDDISFKELCNISDTVYVQAINLTPNIQTNIMLGCDKDSVQFTASNGAGTTPATYQWFFGDGTSSNVQNPLHTYATQGTYNVILYTELNGCSDSSKVTINTLHPFNADFAVVNIACAGQPVSVVNNSTATGPFTNEFNWGDGTIEPSGTHTYTTAGTYTITLVVTDQIGCKDSMSKTITINEPPFASFTMNKTDICIGEPLFLIDSVNSQTESFEWSFGDGSFSANTHNPIHSYEINNTYTIKITAKNSSCPENVFTKDVTVHSYPTVYLGKDTAICPGLTGSILLSNLMPSSGTARWNNGSTNASISVSEPGHYWLELTDNGCATSDSIWIARDCFLNVPNSFSPNGDGLNEYFLPREILGSGIANFSMNIFNRWGENIFTASTIDGRGWDGKYNGVLQPMGVYVYQIDVTFANNIHKSYSGNVTLVR